MIPMPGLTGTEYVVAQWMSVLADAAVKGSVLLALAAAATLAMRRASAAARQLVWRLALAGCLAMPVLTSLLPSWRVLPSWATARIDSPPAEVASADTPAAAQKYLTEYCRKAAEQAVDAAEKLLAEFEDEERRDTRSKVTAPLPAGGL